MMSTPTFVLAHGTWHGGWCYSRVAQILRTKGYEVFTPTATGLRERSHLAPATVNASTHVRDILNVIDLEGLDNIVLASHSYGGMIITAVADAMPEKIRSLGYLEAFIGKDNQFMFYMDAPAATAAYIEMAQSDGGHTVPPLPSQVFGVNQNSQAWVDSRCTPGSLATWAERLRSTGRHLEITNRTHVFAAGSNGAFRPIYDRVREDGRRRTFSLDCRHYVMVDMPQETADVLELAARDDRYSEATDG